MSWKYYKKLFENGGLDENKFILGLDLGSSSSAIAYFNTLTEVPELIDLSGGYGKPSMPSIVQYIPETREWIFGEYALLNKGLFNDYTVTDLMKKIGKKEYIEMGSKTVSAVWLLSKYINELIESCKNINPSCEIAGIVCAVPTYMSDDAKEELLGSFRGAGLEKQLIGFITARESILTHNYYNSGREEKLILIIDYGAEKMRASIERLTAAADDGEGVTNVVTESYYEDDGLGLDRVESQTAELFAEIYCGEKRMDRHNLTEQELNSLYIFSHQNKAQMFKVNQNGRPSKLYFNFAFPPFVKELNNETKKEFIGNLENEIGQFLEKLFGNSKSAVDVSEIERVICHGGGFENPFAKEFIEKSFPRAQITLLKNGKAILAEGACVYAAKKLGVYNGEDFLIKDNALLKRDIGVKISYGGIGRFFPVVERNTFWWKEREGAVFTLTRSTYTKTDLTFYLREKTGEETVLCEIPLDGLESRPKGTTRLKIAFDFEAFGRLKLSVTDFGFGEMYPRTDFKKELTLDLADL